MQLNIGLDSNRKAPGKTGHLEQARRLEVALRKLAPYHVVDWRVASSMYDHNGETVIERTLIVVVSDYSLPVGPLVDMAAALEQDCIAVWDPINRNGSLIGPKADEWGPFDLAFFKQF